MKNKYVRMANQWWLALVWLLSAALSTQAQTMQPPVIEWQRVVEATNPFTGNGPDFTQPAIAKNSQGGYVVLTKDRRLLFLTTAGNIITDTPITGISTARGLTAASDGGVVVGVRQGNSGDDWSLQKRNASGAVMWTYRVQLNLADQFNSIEDVVSTPDGGFVIFGTGGYQVRGGFSQSAIVEKVDKDGVLVWKKSISFSNRKSTFVSRGINTSDDGYLLVGHIGDSPASPAPNQGWATRLDKQGNTIWQKQYDERMSLDDVILNPYYNGSFIASGVNNFYADVTNTLNIGPDGDPGGGFSVPGRVVGTSSALVAVPARNGQPPYHTFLDNVSQNAGDFRLTNAAQNDQPVWTKTLGGSGNDVPQDIITTDDGGYIVVGATTSTDGDVQGKSNTNLATWIVKLKNAAPANALALTQPTYNCSTGAITFNTTGGDGSTITYNAPGISRSLATSNSGIVEQGLRNDPKPITITATQSGNTVSYTFDFGAFCGGTQPPVNPPTPPVTPPTPPTGGTLALTQPTYNCQTGAITFNTTGSDGSTITYNAPGISRSSATNNSGTVEQGLRNDPKPITITATQNGNTVSYTFDFRAFCSGTQPPVNPPTPPVTPPTGGTLALLAPTYDCATGAFTFRSSGGNGSTIEYMAIGITGWTTNPNQFVDRDSRTANDVKPFTLMARQNGQVVTYVWDLKAACGRSQARLGAGERVAELSVSVLGNPVSEAATVEVRGAEGKPLHFRLIDLRGRLVESRMVEQAGASERQRFDLHGQGSGLLLLRIGNGTQTKTVKIMKQ